MYLTRTRAALSDCEAHISSNALQGTPIESYLTQHLLVLLCAEIQQEVYMIAESTTSGVKEEGLKGYISNSGRQLLRSANSNKILEFVSLFGSRASSKYKVEIKNTNIVIYGNAVTNRIKVAHLHGAQVSFSELKSAVAEAEKLLSAVAVAIRESMT